MFWVPPTQFFWLDVTQPKIFGLLSLGCRFFNPMFLGCYTTQNIFGLLEPNFFKSKKFNPKNLGYGNLVSFFQPKIFGFLSLGCGIIKYFGLLEPKFDLGYLQPNKYFGFQEPNFFGLPKNEATSIITNRY